MPTSPNGENYEKIVPKRDEMEVKQEDFRLYQC